MQPNHGVVDFLAFWSEFLEVSVKTQKYVLPLEILILIPVLLKVTTCFAFPELLEDIFRLAFHFLKDNLL
jgi:hypothetical protein